MRCGGYAGCAAACSLVICSHCFGSPYCFGSPCSLALSRLNLFTTLQGHGVLDDCSHFRSKRLAVRLTPSLFCSASGLAHELPKPPRKRVRRLQASFHAPPRCPCVHFTAVSAPFSFIKLAESPTRARKKLDRHRDPLRRVYATHAALDFTGVQHPYSHSAASNINQFLQP